METKFKKYLNEMTVSPRGYMVAGKGGSDLNSLMDVSREYLADTEKMFWAGNKSGAIKALETLQKKIIKDLIETIKNEN